LENVDSLIYDLIFSDNTEYKINVHNYINKKDIYKYDRFIDNIKLVLKKSRVKIVCEKLDVDTNTIIWEIKVKK
jgi:hypothetical protein